MASGWGVGGRPRIWTERKLSDYPPPTPQPTPCRLWQGAVDRDGYGCLTVGVGETRLRQRVPRWIWEMTRGPIPPGMVVRHKCDNRPCFRLSHLELGTVAQNNDDARQRGHLGPPPKLTEADMTRLLAERAAGRTYRQIWDDWPEVQSKVAFTTLRTAVWKGVKGWERPDGFLPRLPSTTQVRAVEAKRAAQIDKYTSWRERNE
jgi:hypothetical protein